MKEEPNLPPYRPRRNKLTKICNTCKLRKKQDEFYLKKSNYKGRINVYLDSSCIICSNTKSEQYRKNNPEKVKGYNRTRTTKQQLKRQQNG